MIKGNKGITLASLIITIVVIFIVASTSVVTSLKSFEVNKLKKMVNDIRLLSDKVSNYYLEYGVLPVLRDDSTNNPISYTYTELDFDKNTNDNSNYYILDLEALGNISLNYGKDGYESPNTTDDVYIINEASHTIYYVKGIEVDGDTYYTIPEDSEVLTDSIPPSKPEIRVISGKQDQEGVYISQVELEIVPGKDNWSEIDRTTYSINGGEEIDISRLQNNIYPLPSNGEYTITAKSYDNNGNASETTMDIQFYLGGRKAPTGISNISYSGTTTVGANIDVNAFSYTITYRNGNIENKSLPLTVSPTTIEVVGSNTVRVTYTEDGISVYDDITITGTPVPIVNLLDMDRTFEQLTPDTNMSYSLDETKGYLNIGYGNRDGYTNNCQVSNVSSDSITVKEPGIGGITVAFAIPLPDYTKQYRVSFDYSGEGKVRAYWSYANSSTHATTSSQALSSSGSDAYDTAGSSGTIDVTIPSTITHGASGYDYLIIMLSSNSGKTKTYSNVIVHEVN